MNTLSTIKGMLFDLDGVLYVGSKAIQGAAEAVQKIRYRAVCHAALSLTPARYRWHRCNKKSMPWDSQFLPMKLSAPPKLLYIT